MNIQDDLKMKEEMNKTIHQLQKIGEEFLNNRDIFEKIELDMSDNLKYVAKIFSLRQYELLEAMMKLKNNETVILIARSIFEGAVYLGCFKNKPYLADDWRNFSFVMDQKRADAEPNKQNIPPEVVEYLNKYKNVIETFRKRDGGFYSTWSKGESIKKLSEYANLSHFYQEYYTKMSNYHHWGTKSFGIRYKCYKSSVNKLDSAEITLEIFSAWCIAISSIRFVLDILVECSQNKAAIEKIKELTKQLKNPQNITSTDCS